MKLNVKSFSLTVGFFWSLCLMLFTWRKILLKGETRDRTIIGKIYYGYNISIPGSLIGGIWAFLDGAIGGALFAILNNRFFDKSD